MTLRSSLSMWIYPSDQTCKRFDCPLVAHVVMSAILCKILAMAGQATAAHIATHCNLPMLLLSAVPNVRSDYVNGSIDAIIARQMRMRRWIIFVRWEHRRRHVTAILAGHWCDRARIYKLAL